MANIKGGSKSDTLTGTNGADRIQGLGGNDTLNGLGGNDTLEGGNGDDTLVPGAGSDTIDGGNGIDTLDYSGWAGAIRVSPLVSYTANTTTPGSGAVEELDGSGALISTDRFTYVEKLIATSGNDHVQLGAENNMLWGGAGDDYLHGGNGDDVIYGGAGDDLIDIGNGSETADGGDGVDTIFWHYNGVLNAVTVDLQAGTVTYPNLDSVETLVSIENVRGNYGNKIILGSDVSNIVQGGSGNDRIDGRGGDDLLVGDFGRDVGSPGEPIGYDDSILGGGGNDLISGDLGSDVLTGGSGADIFVVDTYYGSDRITDFEDGSDKLALYGGLTIAGWEGRDTDGDEVVDAQAARLSNGETILFDGYSAPPASLVGTAPGLVLHSGPFAIPELSLWTQAGGASWSSDTVADAYAAAAAAQAEAEVAAMLAGAEQDARLGRSLDAMTRGQGGDAEALHGLAGDAADPWSLAAAASDPFADAMAMAAATTTVA